MGVGVGFWCSLFSGVLKLFGRLRGSFFAWVAAEEEETARRGARAGRSVFVGGLLAGPRQASGRVLGWEPLAARARRRGL